MKKIKKILLIFVLSLTCGCDDVLTSNSIENQSDILANQNSDDKSIEINYTYFGNNNQEDTIEKFEINKIYSEKNVFSIFNTFGDFKKLADDVPTTKYNEDYFQIKSLLMFYLQIPSMGSKSEITSYEIKDETITLNINLYDITQVTTIGGETYFLELTKEEAKKIQKMQILESMYNKPLDNYINYTLYVNGE